MSPKELKPVPITLVSISETISTLLKAGKTKLDIQAYTGFDSKKVQYMIDRYGLDKGLLIPRLRGLDDNAQNEKSSSSLAS